MRLARPDAFAIALLAAGALMFFLPLLRMAGFVTVIAAVAYWLTMIAIRAFFAARSRQS